MCVVFVGISDGRVTEAMHGEYHRATVDPGVGRLVWLPLCCCVIVVCSCPRACKSVSVTSCNLGWERVRC